MENFIYNEKFYYDLQDLSEDLFETEQEILELPEDWKIVCFGTKTEPIFKFDLDWIMERIDKERFTEQGRDYDEVAKILGSNIDFNIINECMPKLMYENGADSFKVTKQDLVDLL